MNEKKPLILVSNDDGVDAEGLIRLTDALRNLGNIVVFAPDGPRSGMSCAITSSRPITYKKLSQEEGLTVYSCTGTPTDCVKLALSEVLPAKPDLLVSGINHGGNHALAVHYSGTMGAAFEGCVFNVPSIGVSLDNYKSGSDFSESCRLIRILARQVLMNGLPHGVYLNLNVPDISNVKGIAVGRQTDGKWEREYHREEKDGITEYWLTGEFEVSGPVYPDNDITLLDEGYASLVPCKIDVTDYTFINKLKEWDWESIEKSFCLSD